MELETRIRCPYCGTESREQVPAHACVIVYDCPGCGAELRPKEGDCCVFCSFGAEPCPTSPLRCAPPGTPAPEGGGSEPGSSRRPER